MKITKTLLSVAFGAVAACAFADAANPLISFSTPGPDKYADGTTVLDGERYALVWSADGNFDGFNADGTAKDPADKVFCIYPLAKDGRCSTTVFQIKSSEAPEGGEYSVYLLDTRTSATTLSSKDELTVVGMAETKSYAVAGGISNQSEETADKTVNGVAASSAGIVLTDAQAPKITSIKVDGAVVTITAKNIFPGLTYNVRGGLKGDSVVTFSPEAGADSTVNFVIENPNTNFFSIEAK